MSDLDDLRYRFLGKVKKNIETGCLEWQCGFLKDKPYGQFWWGGVDGGPNNIAAHRAAWLLFKGPIPADKQVLHKCNNGACCETEGDGHLYLGNHIQNMRDRDDSGHTSRGSHRYNWKRSQELICDIMIHVRSGKQIQEVCDALGIGWQTLYRARTQNAELNQLIIDTKSARYSKGGKKAWNARHQT